ncbi:MAG: TolC family protein [Ferruginibacter sp.]
MRSRSKWLIVLLFALVYCFMVVQATAQTGPIDIKKAIDIALANNRSLKADSLDISITGSKNKEIKGMYLPQVNYASGWEYNPAIASQQIPGAMLGQPDKDVVPVKFGTKYNMKSGVEVTQTIYKKDLHLQIKESGLRTDISKTKYMLSKEELVYEVSSRFYALQANAEKIRTTEFDYMNMNDILGISKAQYETGILKKIDYESLQINVANLLSQLNQLKTQYKEQLAYFNYLLGLPVAAETVISDDVSEKTYATAKANDLSKRTDIVLSNQMILSKENELKRIRAEKSPTISSYFKFNYQSQFNEPKCAFESDYLNKASTVGLSVSVSLFDGNRRKHRTATAKTELEQLRLEYQQRQDKAQMELVTAKSNFDNNQEEYSITKENLALATRVFTSRKALYTEGVTTLTELLDAERELSKARDLHLQALINVQSGWLDMHKANGTLLTEFIKSI